MLEKRLATWLRWLRATASFVFIAALCLAVALLVIAFIPGSPVIQELPATALSPFARRAALSSPASPSTPRVGSVRDHEATLATAALPAHRVARPRAGR